MVELKASRQVVRRLMMKQAFDFLTGKFGGERRKIRRLLAWDLMKRTYKKGQVPA